MGYYDDADPYRNASGQFHNLLNANIGQQIVAGVNEYDSLHSAYLKTENYRRSMGLDPYTGLVPPTSGVGLPDVRRPTHREPVDESQLGEVFRGLCKAVILWPAAVAVVLGALAFGAATVGMKLDAPTLASRAARTTFSDYQPPPAVAIDGRAPSAPVDAAALVASFRAFRPDKAADPRMLRARALLTEAYRCLLQPGCREAMARIDEVAADNLPRTAAGVFEDRVKGGSEAATRDMCLFAVGTGSSYRDLIAARRLCAEANGLHRNSGAGARALARIDGSWAMRRAWAYDAFAGLRWRWAHA